MIIKTILLLYLLLCIFLFLLQEKLIFFPTRLGKDFQFKFDNAFEELHIPTQDSKLLNAVLFKADSSKGLVFYLHGNAGALDTWGDLAKTYTNLHYDVCMMDYRGYGKSEGHISSETQIFQDVQSVYDAMKKRYAEEKIVVLGYSLGTGFATKLASANHPKMLILQAPYYSIVDIMRRKYPIAPTFILKYKLETNKYIADCKMPIVIFHGDKDEVIYYGSSLKLQPLLKSTDTLITLKDQRHNEITDNMAYRKEIARILE